MILLMNLADKDQYSILFWFDLQKDFDTINCNILLKKDYSAGI